MLKNRFGEDRFRQMLAAIKQQGQRRSLSFDGLERMANSRKALLAAFYAEEQNLQEAFHNGVYQAYFAEGRNIGQTPVLLEIGEQAGLERGKLEAYLSEADEQRFTSARILAKKWEVNAIPTFIVEERTKVVGSDQEEALRQAVEKALQEQSSDH